jgi:hypothetical protein
MQSFLVLCTNVSIPYNVYEFSALLWFSAAEGYYYFRITGILNNYKTWRSGNWLCISIFRWGKVGTYSVGSLQLYNWCDRGQMAGTLTEHDFQDVFKMAEDLGTVHTGGRELRVHVLRRRWWPVGPKLVFDQFWPALVPGSMDCSLYN